MNMFQTIESGIALQLRALYRVEFETSSLFIFVSSPVTLYVYFFVLNKALAKRRLLGLMLVLFFSMTFLLAVGTSNYGTAIRHYMVTWWILVAIGLPSLLDSLRRLFAADRHEAVAYLGVGK